MPNAKDVVKSIEDEISELKQNLNSALQEIQKYKEIASAKIEEYIIPYNNAQDSDVSAYYTSIVNALLDSKNVYTTMIDDLTNIISTLKTADFGHHEHYAAFLDKALISAKWIEHFMKEAVTNLALLKSKASSISRAISHIQNIVEHTNLLVLHTSVNIAKNGYNNNLAATVADKIDELIKNVELANLKIEAI